VAIGEEDQQATCLRHQETSMRRSNCDDRHGGHTDGLDRNFSIQQHVNIRLDGKRALVTGASSGIGRAIAVALAEAGAKVAVNYRAHPDEAREVLQRIKSASGEAIAVQADVSDASAVAAMFPKIDEAWGGIDILVNNAGIDGPRAVAWEANLEAWRKVLEVNLFGAFYCAQQALKRMMPQKQGVILNISSVHEVIAWSGYSAYAASKAGLGMLTKTLAQEAAPAGVRVVALAPGAIKTPINKAVWDHPATFEDLLAKIALNRLGTPEEVARMAVVLVSDIASYVTGRTYYVDGGMTNYPGFAHGG
jgi:NAD(P)-dependent dehydrogenase (short-subunit alcohol dehydrogenase family)